jgi:hypothetical protein
MKTTLLLLCLLLSVTAFSQDKITSDLNLNYSGIRHNDTSSHIRTVEMKVSMPVYKTTLSRIAGSFTYTNEHFVDFPSAFGTDVHGFALGLNWLKYIGGRHLVTVLGQVGLYSDMHHITGNAIRGLIGFNYLTVYSKKLTLGLGAAYARQLYGNQILPLIAVKYKSNGDGRWKLGGIFPTNPKLSYAVSKSSSFSLELKQEYSSYRLTGSNHDGYYIKNTRSTCVVNYEYTFAQAWRITAGVGSSLRQRYGVYPDENSSQWYILGRAIDGAAPQAVEYITHRGGQFHAGIAYNPSF